MTDEYIHSMGETRTGDEHNDEQDSGWRDTGEGWRYVFTGKMTISDLIDLAHANAKAKGFWDDWGHNGYVQEVSTRLMLIVSELGEAVEALRHNNMDNFHEELADVAIRLADLCGGLDIDLEAEIAMKMEVNAGRPHLHGKGF